MTLQEYYERCWMVDGKPAPPLNHWQKALLHRLTQSKKMSEEEFKKNFEEYKKLLNNSNNGEKGF